MANVRAQVVTPWVAAADDSSPQPSNHPQLQDDHALVKWSDVTGQPSVNLTPAPNEYTVEIECTEAVLDAIEADSTYTVLWSEEIVE